MEPSTMFNMVAVKGDQIHEVAGVTGWDGEKTPGVLVVATESGAILFLNTAAWDMISFEPEAVERSSEELLGALAQ